MKKKDQPIRHKTNPFLDPEFNPAIKDSLKPTLVEGPDGSLSVDIVLDLSDKPGTAVNVQMLTDIVSKYRFRKFHSLIFYIIGLVAGTEANPSSNYIVLNWSDIIVRNKPIGIRTYKKYLACLIDEGVLSPTPGIPNGYLLNPRFAHSPGSNDFPELN